MKWEVTDREKMEEGFDKGAYYIGIVIPRNFSQAVISVDSPEPLKGQLEYHVDKSNNYLSGTIGDSIRRELEISLDEKLSKIFRGTFVCPHLRFGGRAAKSGRGSAPVG